MPPTKQEEKALFSQSEIAFFFGKSIYTITDWVRDGCPTEGKKGPARMMDLRKVIEYREKKLGGTVNGQAALTQARTRLASEQAKKQETENQLAEGKLVDVEAVADRLVLVLTNVKTRLLAIPTKAAPTVTGCKTLPQTKDAIEEFVLEALEELSDADAIIGKPKRAGTKAAAKAKRKRVG